MKKIISRKIIAAIAVASFAVVPVSAFAITTGSTSGGPSLCTLSQTVLGYFNIALELIIGLSIVVFVFNVFRYFFTSQENSQRGMYVLWSIIGFAVIACFWGLVNIVGNSFGLSNSTAPAFFGNIVSSNNTSSPCSSTGSSSSGSSSLLGS